MAGTFAKVSEPVCLTDIVEALEASRLQTTDSGVAKDCFSDLGVVAGSRAASGCAML